MSGMNKNFNRNKYHTCVKYIHRKFLKNDDAITYRKVILEDFKKLFFDILKKNKGIRKATERPLPYAIVCFIIITKIHEDIAYYGVDNVTKICRLSTKELTKLELEVLDHYDWDLYSIIET